MSSIYHLHPAAASRIPFRKAGLRGLLLSWLCLLWLLGQVGSVLAGPLDLAALPSGPLGARLEFMLEQDGALELDEVRRLQAQGKFQPASQPVLTFGIGSRPVWVHLQVLNSSEQALPFFLQVGCAWIDTLDLHVIHGGREYARWRSGDAYPGAQDLSPAVGFRAPLVLAPGVSDLYLRAATPDPLVLPIELLPSATAAESERGTHYGYGALYGFLFALIAYNAMLYAGLKERSYLYYSLYLLTFILLNLAYTGHGFAWVWPAQIAFQRYIILSLMVLFSCAGLLFASRFLDLPEHAPRLARAVRVFLLSGLLLQLGCVLGQQHLAAAWVAFSFLPLFALVMVGLGLFAIRRKLVAGPYFLAAALCGMLSAAVTAFAVAGWLPMTRFTFHGVEVGIVMEATLLALALAHQVRFHKAARQQAEHLARIDPLTSLYNRRAFFEMASWAWSMAQRRERPMSLVMLDIDHFKEINDRYGHDAGDKVLVEITHLLSDACRAGDILARWGGEEFVLLLPETNLEQGRQFAERLRALVEARAVLIGQDEVLLTISLGVAERQLPDTLKKLIETADALLYEAKRRGRNQVFAAGLQAQPA